MAITLVSAQRYRVGFIANGASADLSGCEELVAAPGTGKNIYIESISISSNSAINITIGAGETTGAVTTVLMGPIYFAANSNFERSFKKPLMVAINTSLTVDASGAGNATIIVEGYVQ